VKPSTDQCLGHQMLTSANNTTPVTATIPNGTSHLLVTVETNPCRMTLTPGGDPTGAIGLVIPKDAGPWFIAVGQGCTVKFASTLAGASVIQLAYLS